MEKFIMVIIVIFLGQFAHAKSALDPFKIREENKGQNLKGKEESERVQKNWNEIEDELDKLLGLEKKTIDLEVLSKLTSLIEENLSAHSFGLHCSNEGQSGAGKVDENDDEEDGEEEENDENFSDFKPQLKGRSIASSEKITQEFIKLLTSRRPEIFKLLTSRKPEIFCLAKAQMSIFKTLDKYNRAFDSSPSVYAFKGESKCKVENKRFCEWKKLIDRRLQIM